MQRTALCALLVAGILTALGSTSLQADAGTTRAVPGVPSAFTVDYLSGTYEIDRPYFSMQGPYKIQPIRLAPGPRKLLWLTGYEVAVVDAAGAPLPSQQNLCHGQIEYGSAEGFRKNNAKLFEGVRTMPRKWFIVVPGQAGITFPEGFGIPAYSDEPLNAMTMALNQDPDFAPFAMRMRTRVTYREDSPLSTNMKPLGRFAVDVRVPVLDPSANTHADAASCAVTADDGVVAAAESVSLKRTEADGSQTTAHFLVPPGRTAYVQSFRGADQLPFDTTLHSITAHLHVYGTAIELWDTTENRLLFRSEAANDARRTHVTHMTEYSSAEGIPVFRDHEYELRATYENTTGHPVDGMAVMYFYFFDKAYASGVRVM